VSLHAVTDAASVPLSWRLFLPAEWAGRGDERRARTGVPDGVGHREKWLLALDAIDEALGWGLEGRLVVADAGYGQNHAFRVGLAERGVDNVTAVRPDIAAHPGDAMPSAPERQGRMGTPRLPRYRGPARSLKELVTAAGRAPCGGAPGGRAAKGR
jgi:SRSO17 transposase